MTELFNEKEYLEYKRRLEEGFHFYRCDPEKNQNCDKRHCYGHGGKCMLTSDPRYLKKSCINPLIEGEINEFINKHRI